MIKVLSITSLNIPVSLLQEIFLFITRQLKGLEDTKSPQFNRYFYLLEVWGSFRIWMIEKVERKLQIIFTCLFRIWRGWSLTTYALNWRTATRSSSSFSKHCFLLSSKLLLNRSYLPFRLLQQHLRCCLRRRTFFFVLWFIRNNWFLCLLSNSHNQKVQMHMMDLMSSIITEGDGVTQELLDTILINLIPAHKVGDWEGPAIRKE